MAASPPPAPSLLFARLVIVTGKGGTGKTSVVAALAQAAARRGRRVLAVEMGLDEVLPRLLAPGSAPVGFDGRELQPGLVAQRIDPYEALAEYLGLQLGGRALVRRVLGGRAFRQLMDAAPGWRELITLGKVWHLEQMRDGDAPRYDLIVVDAPATGHGLTFLDVPRVTVQAVSAGPLHQHAGWVEELIRDPARTRVLPVSLAEELPVRETMELVERLRGDLALHVDRVVVNAVSDPPFPPALPDLDADLAALPAAFEATGAPRADVLASCARHLRERHAMHLRYRDQLGKETGLPVVSLPALPQGVTGPAELAVLGDALLVETGP